MDTFGAYVPSPLVKGFKNVVPHGIVATSNLLKRDNPYSITFLSRTSIVFNGMCDLVQVQERIKKKRHEFERDWIVFSKYENHSKFTSQHNRGTLYEHLVSMRIFTSIKRLI